MKITLLLVSALAILCFVDGKPHNEGKRAHQIKRAKEHELSNRMGHGDHHRREHSTAHKSELSHRGSGPHEMHKTHKIDPAAHKAEVRKSSVHKKAEALHRRGGEVAPRSSPGGASSSTGPVHDVKKDLHLQHVTEHNVQSKLHDDQDGIPMESERLIHVTPRPLKAHKVNKPHHKPTQTTALKTNTPVVHQRPSFPKTTSHKPSKKYSPKKHGWKKSARKDKGKDKAKEKMERREKRKRALHRVMAAKKL